MTMSGAFVPEDNIALFLDVDGTLLEIAPTPSSVKVPAALRNTLQLAAERESGALAFISGRGIAELDRLFAPSVFPAAGLHGLERRSATGSIVKPQIELQALRAARNTLLALANARAGLLLEDKGMVLAMHYRLAPQHERTVLDAMTALAEPLGDRFALKRGKCVIELTPSGHTKRDAIEAFMREQPFAGRTPVFVGDDQTDEDGFDAVNALRGYSVRVGPRGETRARFSFGSVSAVVAWLRERNLR